MKPCIKSYKISNEMYWEYYQYVSLVCTGWDKPDKIVPQPWIRKGQKNKAKFQNGPGGFEVNYEWREVIDKAKRKRKVENVHYRVWESHAYYKQLGL